MNISTNTIIKKITGETEKLSGVNDDTETVHDVMRNIHLLTELWLEAYQEDGMNAKVSKQMEQADVSPPNLIKNNSENINISTTDTSIFDF